MYRSVARTTLALALTATEPWRAAQRTAGALRRRLRTLGDSRSSARAIRVLVEVESLDRGGLEEAVFRLVTHLDRQRFTPLVVCLDSKGVVAERLAATGVRIEVIGRSGEAYQRLLARERIDLVNSHYSSFGARWARRAGIPNVHILHNSYLWMDEGGLRRLAWKLREAQHFIAVSSTVAAWARRALHIRASQMEIIPNAVDASRLLPAAVGSLRVATRRELGIAEDAFVFLLIGTYEPRKGHRALFRALSRAAGGEKTVAICAGNSVDPHYREECRQRADAPDLRGRVRLLDFCEAPARLYAAADALVQPSVVEGFSLTSLEAAAFGLPLVLTDVGGARELLERHPIGLLVPGYLEDLAEAAPSDVDRVLNQPPEAVVDGLAAAMSQMRVQAATWRAAAQRHAAPVAQEHEPREIAKRYERRFDLALGR